MPETLDKMSRELVLQAAIFKIEDLQAILGSMGAKIYSPSFTDYAQMFEKAGVGDRRTVSTAQDILEDQGQIETPWTKDSQGRSHRTFKTSRHARDFAEAVYRGHSLDIDEILKLLPGMEKYLGKPGFR